MYSETVCPVSATKTGSHLIAFAGIFCQSTDKHWWNLVTVGYKDLDCSVQNQNGQIQLERPTLLWNWCKWMQTNRVSRGKREIFSWRDRKLSQCGSHCETWMKFQQFFSPPVCFFFPAYFQSLRYLDFVVPLVQCLEKLARAAVQCRDFLAWPLAPVCRQEISPYKIFHVLIVPLQPSLWIALLLQWSILLRVMGLPHHFDSNLGMCIGLY